MNNVQSAQSRYCLIQIIIAFLSHAVNVNALEEVAGSAGTVNNAVNAMQIQNYRTYVEAFIRNSGECALRGKLYSPYSQETVRDKYNCISVPMSIMFKTYIRPTKNGYVYKGASTEADAFCRQKGYDGIVSWTRVDIDGACSGTFNDGKDFWVWEKSDFERKSACSYGWRLDTVSCYKAR